MTIKRIYGSVCVAVFCLLAISCGNGQRTIKFEGICADAPQGTCGLYNPGRGFRLETALDVALDKDKPAKQLAQLSEKYASDSVSLSQSYFYLTFLADKILTENDFATMQAYFDELRRQGKKSVLRFAYEKDFMGRSPIGPTAEQILRHLDQLLGESGTVLFMGWKTHLKPNVPFLRNCLTWFRRKRMYKCVCLNIRIY